MKLNKINNRIFSILLRHRDAIFPQLWSKRAQQLHAVSLNAPIPVYSCRAYSSRIHSDTSQPYRKKFEVGNDSATSVASEECKQEEMVKAHLNGVTGADASHTRLVLVLEQNIEYLNQLRKQKEMNEKDYLKLFEAMKAVAETQDQLGMLKDAQSMYEEMLSYLLSIHSQKSVPDSEPPPDNEYVAETMHCMGSIQSRVDNYTESQKWFDSALKMKKRLYSSGGSLYHREIGKTLYELAMLYITSMTNDEEEISDQTASNALDLLQEADLNCRYHGCNGPDENKELEELGETEDKDHTLSLICANMALLFRKQMNFSLALERYEEALSLRKRYISPENGVADEMIVSLYTDIGDCLVGLDQKKDALECYKEALKVHIILVKRERTSHDSKKKGTMECETGVVPITNLNPTIGTSVEAVLRQNIAMILSQTGNHDEAQEEYQLSLAIKKKLVGEDHPEVARTLNAIGVLMVTKRDVESALAHFREALRIYRAHSSDSWFGSGEADESISGILKNIQMIEKSLLSGKIANHRF